MNCFKSTPFLLGLGAIFALSCSGMASPHDYVNYPGFSLTGKVSNIPENGSKTMIVNECDISCADTRQVVEFDSLGFFSIKIPINYGHTFTIIYSGQIIEAYAEPNDSIHIEIDASQLPSSYTLSGNHGTFNEEYSHALNSISSYWWDITLPPDTIPVSEYFPAFKSEAERIQEKIDTFTNENNISSEVADMLRVNNLFTVANSAILYRGNGKEDILAFFTNPMFDIGNDKNAKVMIFPYHLSALIAKIPEYAEQMPQGLIRDIMLIKWAEETDKTPERSEFSDTAYYDRVFGEKDTTIEIGKINPSQIIVYENDSAYNVANTNPISWLIDRFTGKPIYLDISATWCGPCRATLAKSEGVREHFKESDIVFALIWLRSNLEQWQTLVPPINNAVHIFVSNEDVANQIMGKLNIGGFPSYYLIDKEGVIKSDIPKYLSPNLLDFLNTLK